MRSANDWHQLKIKGADDDPNMTYGGDYEGKDIISLPDEPDLTAEQLKQRFDALSKLLVVPKFNALIDAIQQEFDSLREELNLK
ncbi:MAG: hypothetical protein IKY59_06490 [Oscillospiraceae bacterium]|nr:hypothetical protein [Oscillospiraceae bacterium]